MGNFSVEVSGVGGHGCQRDVKSGGLVQMYCGSTGCPDCMAREFVRDLQSRGHAVTKAVLIHWPGSVTEVRDDLITLKRTGSF